VWWFVARADVGVGGVLGGGAEGEGGAGGGGGGGGIPSVLQA